jgi:nickel/cobalt exporter
MIAAVLAVGLRPCSGAIIVLVFSLTQGIFIVGIIGVAAMSLGTGLTVSVLAALAVGAKEIAVRLAARRPRSMALVSGLIRLAAGLLVLLFGASLLAVSLSKGL